VDRHPLSEKAAAAVVECREAIRRILRHEDPRLLAVVGPCSIHDYQAALDYARRLRALKQRYASRLHILMRVYFEKPRTTVGWAWADHRPQLNGTYDINAGPGAGAPAPAGDRRAGPGGRHGDGWTPSCRSTSPT